MADKLPTLKEVLGGSGHGGSSSLPSLNDVLNGNHAVARPQHKGGGHGFLHGLEHVAGQTVHDLYDTAVHSPSGLYQVGKAVAQATAGNPKPLKDIAVATGKGTVEDFKHPLRHPGNTALDVGAVLSLGAGSAARVAEVGRVVKAGEEGSIARAALKGPKPQARDIKYGDTSISAGTYSRSALRRSSQKLYDEFQQRFPDTRLPLRNLHERVGHELGTDRRIVDAIGRAPAHALAKIKLSLPKQKALQVVAEGLPVADRIRFHEAQLPELKGKLAASTRKEISSLKASEQYIHDVNGMPRIRPEHHDLADVYQKAHAVATKREELLGVTPKLTRKDGKVVREQALVDEAAAGRITGPGLTINPAHHFDPELVPELFRVPHVSRKALPALYKQQGYKGGIGRTPGSLKKTEYAVLKSGAGRNDTTRLVAESYLEAHRFAALMKHRDEFLNLAHEEKMSPHDIPIRSDALLNRQWPKELQDISERPALSKEEMQALGNHYEDTRLDLFPKESELLKDEQYLATGVHPDVKWIDRRVLGGLDRPNPIDGWPKKGVATFDAINNSERAAILYLKPAYAVPNILGNAALNIVQQGWGAPAQVARSARLWANLDKETRAVVKQAMGEGVTGSLHSEAGVGSRAINKMAELWQGPVDTPFRANAFFYEARRFGYKTPAQIKKLMGDEKELLKVAREANSEVIDYGRLGPFEQNVVRRVIFFYPWVKGSSVYAARFITTHPMQAALAGQLGKQGAERDMNDLGPLPSYAEGLFKVGERGHNSLVLNPSSAGILQTPADLLKMVTELGSGHPGQAFNLGQNFTPALQSLLTLANHGGARRNESSLDAVIRQLVAGLPAVTTAQGLMHPPADSNRPRVYPRTARDVLLHYLVGGLAPTPINLSKAHAAKYLEDHPH